MYYYSNICYGIYKNFLRPYVICQKPSKISIIAVLLDFFLLTPFLRPYVKFCGNIYNIKFIYYICVVIYKYYSYI